MDINISINNIRNESIFGVYEDGHRSVVVIQIGGAVVPVMEYPSTRKSNWIPRSEMSRFYLDHLDKCDLSHVKCDMTLVQAVALADLRYILEEGRI